MKLFLDSANLDEIRAAVAAGLVDGITTNPTLLAREHVVLEEFLPQVCELVAGPVSAPVRGTDADEIVREGRALAKLHDGVTVKIGIDLEGLRAVAKLHAEGIRTHATLCCSAHQALLAARAGADFVSPLVGRVNAAGGNGLELVSQIIDIYDNYEFDTQILVASLRSPSDVIESARLGADGITAPKALLEELARHPLSDSIQLEFRESWKQI
jgi:transaldolase